MAPYACSLVSLCPQPSSTNLKTSRPTCICRRAGAGWHQQECVHAITHAVGARCHRPGCVVPRRALWGTGGPRRSPVYLWRRWGRPATNACLGACLLCMVPPAALPSSPVVVHGTGSHSAAQHPAAPRGTNAATGVAVRAGKSGALGHGDTSKRAVGRQVKALGGQAVLAVACGADWMLVVAGWKPPAGRASRWNGDGSRPAAQAVQAPLGNPGSQQAAQVGRGGTVLGFAAKCALLASVSTLTARDCMVAVHAGWASDHEPVSNELPVQPLTSAAKSVCTVACSQC